MSSEEAEKKETEEISKLELVLNYLGWYFLALVPFAAVQLMDHGFTYGTMLISPMTAIYLTSKHIHDEYDRVATSKEASSLNLFSTLSILLIIGAGLVFYYFLTGYWGLLTLFLAVPFNAIMFALYFKKWSREELEKKRKRESKVETLSNDQEDEQ